MLNVVVDIDGTVADLTHRRHYVATKPKNWKAFNALLWQDRPIEPIVKTIRALRTAGAWIVFVSGREGTDTIRKDTQDWLLMHNVADLGESLFMRAAGDYRPDDVVKEEILDTKLLPMGFVPDLIFDDRDRVVAMWRRRGFRVAQVAEGNF